MRAALIVMMLAGPAAADPKPTIVIPNVDASWADGSAKAADKVTASLRAVAAAKTGIYQIKGTPKEIAAAVIKAECKLAEPTCAATVGGALGADYLLSGELQPRGEHFVIQLSLVHVKTKQRVRSLRSVAATAALEKSAKLAYAQLVDATTGELTIVTNAKQGDLVLDGQTVGQLWEGRATVSGLALGSHQVQIRAKGYKPITVDVRIDGTNTENLLLEPIGS